MASECLGIFGVYRDVWTKTHSANQSGRGVQPYTPNAVQTTALAPRNRMISADYRTMPSLGNNYLPPLQRSVMYQDMRQSRKYPSHPSTRCEDWSTLRQMLPSQGFSERLRPVNWGTGDTQPPYMSGQYPRRFAHLNSPMTRYINQQIDFIC